jgi:hypothetical protein
MFPPSTFHHFELSPRKMQETVAFRFKSFKYNVLLRTRTSQASQNIPLDGGTVPPPENLLTKNKKQMRRIRLIRQISAFACFPYFAVKNIFRSNNAAGQAARLATYKPTLIQTPFSLKKSQPTRLHEIIKFPNNPTLV